MVFYVVTREHSYTMRAYAHDWDRLRLVFYDDLFGASSLSVGTYIFTDLDRLTSSERQLAAAVWHQLAVSTPRMRLLNNPETVLDRYELMHELAEAGENQFRARRLAEGLDGLRYPVFVRSEREHDGTMTPLLHGPTALWRALASARMKGYRARDLLIVEFCDTSDSSGLFRKYSAFLVDGEVLPRHMLISRNWHLKKPDIADAKAELEVEAYLEGNPHEDAIRRMFDRASIDYGRIDYSMLGDRLQVWEINTNPLVKQLAKRLTAAFARLDAGASGDGRSIPISLNPQLLAKAARERNEESRAQKRRELISAVITAPFLRASAEGARLLRSKEPPPAVKARETGAPSTSSPTVESAPAYEERMQALANCLDVNDRKDQRRSAQALAKLYFELLRVVSPPLFIEAGARDASVSLRAREILPSARIVAFEPSPFNVTHFKSETDYEGIGIEYEPLALADVPGNLRLYVPRSVDGIEVPVKNALNSLLKRASAEIVYDEIEVRAVALDDFFPASVSDGCCVWIDVEGASGKVISGGKRLLGQTQLLMIEVEDRVVWHDQWLAEDVLKFLAAIRLVPVARDFQWWPDNYNIICVRYDLLDRDDIRDIIDRFHSGAKEKWRKPKDKASGGTLLRATRKARDLALRVFRFPR